MNKLVSKYIGGFEMNKRLKFVFITLVISMGLSGCVANGNTSVAVIPTLVPTAIPSQITYNIKIGEYVQLGRYYDEPILWRCIDID